MKRIATLITLLGLITVFVAPFARATDVVSCDGLTKAQCSLVSEDKLNYKSSHNVIWDIVRFILIALGAIAVIMIIVGGFQYVTSQGDSSAISKAKNTILYAIVGLAVALLATGIVTFIIDKVPK
ncbi:MAG: pilin [Candidatus Saccharimonas sp.]